jgi:hypothetical protein
MKAAPIMAVGSDIQKEWKNEGEKGVLRHRRMSMDAESIWH